MAELGLFPWGTRTFVMGVLNATPDSFSGDGIYRLPTEIAARALDMVTHGADLLDIGGESTRPGHAPVPAEEEIRRVVPAIQAVAGLVPVPISVDTRKAAVARQALAAGASVVNDVSGLHDPEMPEVVAAVGAGLVVVHADRTEPGKDLLKEISRGLANRIEVALSAGVAESFILIDPGFGFGKGWRENFEIIRRLDELAILGPPILVGPSRKGMVGRVLGVGVDDRLEGTAALVALSIARGADVIRVHDVREMWRVARMTDALVRVEPDQV